MGCKCELWVILVKELVFENGIEVLIFEKINYSFEMDWVIELVLDLIIMVVFG